MRAAAIVGGLIFGMSVAARAEPMTIETFLPDAGGELGASMIVYDAGKCDFAPECSAANLSCAEADALQVSIDGLDTAGLVRWLQAEKIPTIRISGMHGDGVPYFSKIEINDMDETWSASFRLPYSPDPGLVADTPLTALILETLAASVTVGLDGENAKRFVEFIDACRRD